jgi:hypothetical protein
MEVGMGIGGLVLGISVRVEFGRGCIDRRVALVLVSGHYISHSSFLSFPQDLAWFPLVCSYYTFILLL